MDIKKVNMEIMKTWIAKEIVSYLNFEDEMLIDMIYNMLTVDEVSVCFAFLICRFWTPNASRSRLFPSWRRMLLDLLRSSGRCFFLRKRTPWVFLRSLSRSEWLI